MADIRTLVVDDEPAARRGLRKLLDQEPGISVIGEARNGQEAVAMILELRPDLVFLDIQMPELNGFEVIEAVSDTFVPAIVFVTAYNEWAVRAFEVQALDYILKPYEDRRLRSVVERARLRLSEAPESDLLERIQSVLRQQPGGAGYLKRLIVRESGTVQFVSLDNVDWIEAVDYYVRVHAGKTTQLVRYTMSDLERQLDPMRFMRVHRSAIVNIAQVREIRVAHQNQHEVVLHSGARIPLSRSKKTPLEEVLQRA